MPQDELFAKPQNKQFEFDDRVVSVFDDMITRSVPFYHESLNLGIDFVIRNLPSENSENSGLLDLGSSSGNFLISLADRLSGLNRPHFSLTGIDNSPAMVEYAKNKALAYGYPIDFLCGDILQIDFQQSHFITAYYTLQFIRPIMRETLVKKIYQSLAPNGMLILSEKVNSSDKILDKQMIDHYHSFKGKQGYTQNEISTKREALENVLIPYTLDENIALLKNAGFRHIEIIFKWVNFVTLFALK